MNESSEIIAQDEAENHPTGLCGLADCYVGGEYDVTLKLFSDKHAKAPECSHHMKGTCKHSLLKLMAIGGLVAAAAAALICLARACCFSMCRHK